MAFDHIATKGAIHISARFNDGRFRVTTEANLQPLARFRSSMVSR
jgi:hypothetical protein